MSHIATVRPRGGDYKLSTSKDQTRPQDDKEIHTHNTQATQNSTISTRVNTERSLQDYQSSNRSLDLGTCGIGPSRFRCATLIVQYVVWFYAGTVCTCILRSVMEYTIMVFAIHSEVLIKSSKACDLQYYLATTSESYNCRKTIPCNNKVSLNTPSTADKQTFAPKSSHGQKLPEELMSYSELL